MYRFLLGSYGSPLQTKALAKEALRTVLRKSGSESPTTGSPEVSSSQFSFYNSINSDPLRNMDFNHDQSPDPLDDGLDAANSVKQSKTLIRSQSEMEMPVGDRSRRISSESLTTVLPEAKLHVRKDCKPEDIFSDSESPRDAKITDNPAKSSPGKKLGHKRSRSDGVKNMAANSVDGKIMDSEKAHTLGARGHSKLYRDLC